MRKKVGANKSSAGAVDMLRREDLIPFTRSPRIEEKRGLKMEFKKADAAEYAEKAMLFTISF